MPCVGRQYEVTSRAPFECLLSARIAPHRRGAMTADDVNRFGVEMTQRSRRAARRELNDMLVGFIVAVEIAKRALDAIPLARPRSDFHRLHVFDIHAADKRRALAF